MSDFVSSASVIASNCWRWPTAGTWPEWLAAIVTAAAAWIALREYRRNGQARREAQARLVYAGSDFVGYYAANERLPVDHVDAGSGFEETRDDLNDFQLMSTEPVVLVRANIRNLSQELTGAIRVEVALDGQVVDGLAFVAGGGIEPQSSLAASIIVPSPRSSDDPDVQLRVTFRDAAGRCWVRLGNSPVRELSPREAEIKGPERPNC